MAKRGLPGARHWSPIWNRVDITRREKERLVAIARGPLPSDRIEGWAPPAHYDTKLLQSAAREAKRARWKQEKEGKTRLEESLEAKRARIAKKLTKRRSNGHTKDTDA